MTPNNRTAYLPEEHHFEYTSLEALEQYSNKILESYVDAGPPVIFESKPEWLGQFYKDGNPSV